MTTKHINPLLLDEGAQPRLSRYTFPFEREGHKLVFNSRTRNFHEVNEALFEILKDFSPENAAQLDEDTLAQMPALKWIASEQEDDNYVLGLHNEHLLGTAFADDNCRRCAMLPICQGGCPRHRIHNLSKPVHRIDLCNIYSQNDGEALYDFLFDYYKTSKCNRQDCNCDA